MDPATKEGCPLIAGPRSIDRHEPWTRLEADLAFTAASRARRRAALLGRVRRPGRAICGLPVYDQAIQRRSGPRGVTEIPLEAIAGTTEPNRAAQFDQHFRPKPLTRGRWQRVWRCRPPDRAASRRVSISWSGVLVELRRAVGLGVSAITSRAPGSG